MRSFMALLPLGLWLLLPGCSSSDKDKVTSKPASLGDAPAKGIRIAVLADRSGDQVLKQQGCELVSGVRVGQCDLVLLGVSCFDGVKPLTSAALNVEANKEVPRVGLLLTQAFATADKDLLELVELEARAVLASALGDEEAADQLPVLRTDDPEIGKKIKAITDKPAKPVRLKKMQR